MLRSDDRVFRVSEGIGRAVPFGTDDPSGNHFVLIGPTMTLLAPPLLGFINQLLLLLAFADMSLPLDEPGRVLVRDVPLGKVVCGSQGESLRGATVAYYKFRRDTIGQPGYPETDYATNPAFWDLMSDSGVNAVRLVFFDGWQRSHGDPQVDPLKPYPFTSLSPADAILQGATSPEEANQISHDDRVAMYIDFDKIVDLAAERNMYLMINYHDATGYRDPDFASGLAPGQRQFGYQNSTRYLYQFWNRIAPRYADRTHVFYELMNEPVGYHPNDYTLQDSIQMVRLYRRVRSLAPETHLVLGSFTTPASFNERSMRKIAREMEVRGVDFSNASIGFHSYAINPDLPHTVQPIAQTMRRYPVINTEQGLPDSLKLSEEDPTGPGYWYHLLGSRSMERLHVGWFAWNTFGPAQFNDVWVDTFRSDAIAKNYFWGSELSLAEGLNRLQQTMTTEAQSAYLMAKPLFLQHIDTDADCPE